MTSRTPEGPRRLREARKPRQNTSSPRSPTSSPSASRAPAVVIVGGDHRRYRGHLLGRVTYVQTGRVEIDVRKRGVFERTGMKGPTTPPEAGADPRQLGLGNAGVDSQGRDEAVHAAGGDTVHRGFRHHGVQRLVDPPARFASRGVDEPVRSVPGSAARRRRPGWRPIGAGLGCIRSCVLRCVRSGRCRSDVWLRFRSVLA